MGNALAKRFDKKEPLRPGGKHQKAGGKAKPGSPGNLKQSVGGLKQRPGNLKQSLGGLKQSPGNLKQSAGGLKQSPGGLKQSPGNLKQAAKHKGGKKAVKIKHPPLSLQAASSASEVSEVRGRSSASSSWTSSATELSAHRSPSPDVRKPVAFDIPSNARPKKLTGKKSPTNTVSGKKSPTHFLGGKKSPTHSLSGKKSPTHSLSGEKSPTHLLSGKKSPTHSLSGKKSPTHSLSGKKSPTHSLSGKKSPTHSLNGKKSPTNIPMGQNLLSNTAAQSSSAFVPVGKNSSTLTYGSIAKPSEQGKLLFTKPDSKKPGLKNPEKATPLQKRPGMEKQRAKKAGQHPLGVKKAAFKPKAKKKSNFPENCCPCFAKRKGPKRPRPGTQKAHPGSPKSPAGSPKSQLGSPQPGGPQLKPAIKQRGKKKPHPAVAKPPLAVRKSKSGDMSSHNTPRAQMSLNSTDASHPANVSGPPKVSWSQQKDSPPFSTYNDTVHSDSSYYFLADKKAVSLPPRSASGTSIVGTALSRPASGSPTFAAGASRPASGSPTFVAGASGPVSFSPTFGAGASRPASGSPTFTTGTPSSATPLSAPGMLSGKADPHQPAGRGQRPPAPAMHKKQDCGCGLCSCISQSPKNGTRGPAKSPGSPRTKDQRALSPHGKGQRPLSPHSKGQTPLSPHSEGQRPLSPHGNGQRPLSPHRKGQRPLSPHIQGQRPLSPHGNGQRPLSPHSKGQRPLSPHSKGQRPLSPHGEGQRAKSPHGSELGHISRAEQHSVPGTPAGSRPATPQQSRSSKQKKSSGCFKLKRSKKDTKTAHMKSPASKAVSSQQPNQDTPEIFRGGKVFTPVPERFRGDEVCTDDPVPERFRGDEACTDDPVPERLRYHQLRDPLLSARTGPVRVTSAFTVPSSRHGRRHRLAQLRTERMRYPMKHGSVYSSPNLCHYQKLLTNARILTVRSRSLQCPILCRTPTDSLYSAPASLTPLCLQAPKSLHPAAAASVRRYRPRIAPRATLTPLYTARRYPDFPEPPLYAPSPWSPPYDTETPARCIYRRSTFPSLANFPYIPSSMGFPIADLPGNYYKSLYNPVLHARVRDSSELSKLVSYRRLRSSARRGM